MAEKTTPIRVLIVEDTAVCRELLVSILQSTPGIQVVGTARDGLEAIRLVKRLKPDLVTMDINMPNLDGFEATRQIMVEAPCPIVMISNSLEKYEGDHAFDALKAGALTVLQKPTIHDSAEVYATLVARIKLMAEVKVVRRWQSDANGQVRRPTAVKPVLTQNQKRKSKIQLVAMAASTGGPGALATILQQLPADFPVPILVVQHVTTGFGNAFAAWLDKHTPLKVRLGQHAGEPQAGQVLVAPDNYHMGVNSLGLITLKKATRNDQICPSADYLFHSVANVYGATAVGITLTGMGSDGAEGLQAMHKLGAHTIAQDEATCVIFGMPAAAIKLGVIEQVQPLQKIAKAVVDLI
jgi:two-component system chemotaxis response regulator CheB